MLLTVFSHNANNLPIKKIATHPAKNSWGTVFLFPQVHLYPDSNPKDPKNDTAELVQKETYQTLDYLLQSKNIKFIMVEGDLYGEVSTEKIKTIRDKIDNDFSGRETILLGAPENLKAAGRNIVLYGSENSATREESKKILSNFIQSPNKHKHIRKKLNEIVLNQRNKETAENFSKGLWETNNNVGVLQFGAAHTKGLIRELNKQGLTVIVITVDGVST